MKDLPEYKMPTVQCNYCFYELIPVWVVWVYCMLSVQGENPQGSLQLYIWVNYRQETTYEVCLWEARDQQA